MNRWPSPKAEKKVRARVHELIDVWGAAGKDVREVTAKGLDPVIRGWGSYFEFGIRARCSGTSTCASPGT
jgi:hypothetical protein